MAEQLWERQDGESSRAYQAFVVYRDLGPERSIDKAIAAAGKARGNRGHWQRWSSAFRWVDRAAAWDDEQDRIKRAAQAQAVVEMAERHALIARLALQSLQDWLSDRADVGKLSWSSASQLLDIAAKIERNARGLGTDGSPLVAVRSGTPGSAESGEKLVLLIKDLEAQQQALKVILEGFSGDADSYARLLTVYGQNAERIGGLLKVQRLLSGQAAEGIAGVIQQALDELSAELGVKL